MSTAIWTPELDRLPPAYQLLLRETEFLTEKSDLLGRLKTLWPELQRQAEWGFGNHQYVDVSDGSADQIDASLFAGVDPFDSLGKCSDIPCRVKSAMDIGRSLGLYVNRALIFDNFSSQLLFVDEIDDRVLYEVFGQALILHTLRPLLASGLFAFASPFYSVCRTCSVEFKLRVRQLRSVLYEEYEDQLQLERNGEMLVVHTKELFGGNMVHYRQLSEYDLLDLKKGVDLRTVARRALRAEVGKHISGTFNSMRFTSRFGATTFSTSRIGLLAARKADGATPCHQDIAQWEASRSASLPWIGNLDMDQVVELRNQAASALPQFRERLKQLSAPAPETTEKLAQEVVAELRDSAFEIESELNSIRFSGRSRVRNAIAFSALTLAVYGYSQEGIPLAATGAGLFALLHRLHESHTKEKDRVSSLASQPGYILVKAKEFLEHAK